MPGAPIDISGRRFGRWLVIAGPRSRRGQGKPRVQWLCRCDCGTERWVFSELLRRGSSESCGCLAREITASRGTHHASGTPLYQTWRGMIERCENPESSQFHLYGGRGIKVCRRWRESFEAFRDDMGPKPTIAHQIDRIDNSRDYEPGNCRWATPRENSANTRRNVVLEHDGKRLCVSEWARQLGIVEATLRRRLRMGWSIERALTAPVDATFRHKVSLERDVRPEDRQ